MHLEMEAQTKCPLSNSYCLHLDNKMYKGIEKLTFCGNILWQHFFQLILVILWVTYKSFITTWRGQQSNSITKLRRTRCSFERSLLIFWVQKSVTFPQFLWYLHFLYYWNWRWPFYQRPSCLFMFHENVLSIFSSWYSETSFPLFFSLSFP